MATAADVPGIYDVVINAQGYMFIESADTRAVYGWSPTFLERQNVGAQYGDDQQDFFLTAMQHDWSLGEERKHVDLTTAKQYWTGTNVDPVTVPGQVSMRNTMASVAFAAAIVSTCALQTGNIFAASATTLYEVTVGGTITGHGAHGMAPGKWGLSSDGKMMIIGDYTTGFKNWDGSVYTGPFAFYGSSFCYLGNTLYAYDEAQAIFKKWDGSTSTDLFNWKDNSGAAISGTLHQTRLRADGGKILILRAGGVSKPAELWQYDGSATSQLAELPGNFVAGDMEVVLGVAYISGYLDLNSDQLPCIYFFNNGVLGQLWRSQTTGVATGSAPAIASYNGGIAFTDDTQGKLMWYNLETGGVHTMASYTVTGNTPLLASNKDFLLHIRNQTTGYRFPTTTVASTATITSSLFDFGNSMTKQFRGVRIEFDPATTGGSVDIAYQIDSVDGSWTTLQTGVTSGTEYIFSNVSGHSISIKITLNKGSVGAPVLKRLYVRAAPVLSQYRQFTYLVDCSGKDGRGNVKLRNGRLSPLDGQEMAANLKTAITSESPISVSDRFGTFTAMLGPDKCQFEEIRPEEYQARIVGREV